MSVEKCAELIVKAAANDMREVWISTQVCAALLSMLIAFLQCIWGGFLDLTLWVLFAFLMCWDKEESVHFLKLVLLMHQRSCPWCFVCHYCKSLCWACVHSFADVVIFGHFAGRWYCSLTLSLILFCSLCFWCCIWCSISQNLGLLLWIG
jgi:hypothetical protein